MNMPNVVYNIQKMYHDNTDALQCYYEVNGQVSSDKKYYNQTYNNQNGFESQNGIISNTNITTLYYIDWDKNNYNNNEQGFSLNKVTSNTTSEIINNLSIYCMFIYESKLYNNSLYPMLYYPVANITENSTIDPYSMYLCSIPNSELQKTIQNNTFIWEPYLYIVYDFQKLYDLQALLKSKSSYQFDSTSLLYLGFDTCVDNTPAPSKSIFNLFNNYTVHGDQEVKEFEIISQGFKDNEYEKMVLLPFSLLNNDDESWQNMLGSTYNDSYIFIKYTVNDDESYLKRISNDDTYPCETYAFTFDVASLSSLRYTEQTFSCELKNIDIYNTYLCAYALDTMQNKVYCDILTSRSSKSYTSDNNKDNGLITMIFN